MTHRPPDSLDLRSIASPPASVGPAGPATPRPWLAVRWRCCSTYSRVYRHPDATEYVGGCPRCGKGVRVKVGPGGTGNRFFEAG